MENRFGAFILSVVCLGVILIVTGLTRCIEAAGTSSYNESDLATHLIEKAEISRGVCSILGCDDGKLGLELARSGRFLVHILDPRDSAVAAARELADESRLYGQAMVVEPGSFAWLPYADNTVDVVLATHLTERNLEQVSLSEVLRVLRPRGHAFLGSRTKGEGAGTALSAGALKGWLTRGGVEEFEVYEDRFGLWARVTKPALAGVDDWSHWEHGPDNNPVSTDTVIKAPYITQWLGRPLYIAMPAITTVAGGRIFVAMGHIAHHEREEPWLNTLQARNGYNGTELWRRKLPDGYLVHRSAFIATDDTFYMIDLDGSGCLLLEPETGQEKGRIDIPDLGGEWKWMALDDGKLFALVGEEKDPAETTIVRSQFTHWSWGELSRGYYQQRVPWGFGDTIVAYDLDKKKVLWTHKEDVPVDSRAMAMGDGKAFFYGPDSHIGCLDAKSGTLLWTNGDPKVRELIEEPGHGLGSTPGFRTTCFCLYTPQALFYEAQTRMNVVAVSNKDGRYLWHRRKTTNNPNMLHVDGTLLVGIGPEGSTLVLDPLTGETLEDLGFKKRSCVRLTASPDSFFCRGWQEGLTRYDRNSAQILFNGAVRPSCNDGVIPANGLLYMGPWLCDCNLSLMGTVSMCSSGDFQFERDATEAERWEVGEGDAFRVASFETSTRDWPTYRGNNARSASSRATVPEEVGKIWAFQPDSANEPSAASAAGGLIFLCGSDGKVRAIDAATGKLKWRFMTAGPIVQPPSVWNGRAYVGSGDGYVYALEAATGRMLWRFRAAPVERRIMAYGSLCSTWPVNSGVLIDGGVAYATAGIIDYDGTYVYALDAVTGEIKWQNNTSGHLKKELRKGVSAQGDLTIASGRLWMPGGNVVSPAAYDLRTGEYVGAPVGDGSPQANRGEEIGTFDEHYVLVGGRLRYSATENVVNPGTFTLLDAKYGNRMGGRMPLNQGKVPPAWSAERMVFVDGRYTMPVCCKSSDVVEYLAKRRPKSRPRRAWAARALRDRDTVSLAIARNAILAVCESPLPRTFQSRWAVCRLNPEDGSLVWQQDLPSSALPGGLLVDRDGRVIVVMQNGNLVCFGGDDALRAYITAIKHVARESTDDKQRAIQLLNETLKGLHRPDARNLVIASLQELGIELGDNANKAGCIVQWKLVGPVPWDDASNNVDRVFIGEPNVDVAKFCKVGERILKWQEYVTGDADGMVDLVRTFGPQADVAVYAYAEVNLPEAQELMLKIGSNDGFKCWFNGKEVGRFDGGRAYAPDQDTLRVEGKKGVNKILLKITQMGAAWAFSARLTDLDSKPIDLTRSRG